MTIRDLIEELERQKRIVGPDAPVHTCFQGTWQCEECRAEEIINETAHADSTKIRNGIVVIEGARD